MTSHGCSVFRCWVSRIARAISILAVCFYAVPSVWAQPADEARAKELFEEGRVLMEQGSFGEAAAKFEAAHQIFPAVGTLLNLGVARRENDELIEAWGAFDRAADLARRTGDKRESYARERIEELAPRLYLLRIAVPEQARAPGLVIKSDGAPVSETRWNTDFPVPRGTHAIRAERPGTAPFETRVEVTTAGKVVEVVIPAPTSEPAASPPASEPEPTTSPSVSVPDVSAGEEGSSGMPMGRKVALGSAAVGALGLVTGGFLGLRASGQYDDAESICPVADAASCDLESRADSQALRDDARGTANLATISLAVGLAAGVTGAVLWFTSAPDDQESQASARILPLVEPGVAGVSVRVGF
jgi:tetratricopeptide (TPR) repeat protein